MKLKVNAVIFLILTTAVVLLDGCSIPTTMTAVIVDLRSKPIPKAGLAVTATYGPSNSKKVQTTTAADGTAKLTLTDVSYPVTVTANDGGANKYSVVTIPTTEAARSTVTIVQSPKLVVHPDVSPVR